MVGLVVEPVVIPWPVVTDLVVVVIPRPMGMAIVLIEMAELALMVMFVVVVMFEVVLLMVVMSLVILEPLVMVEPEVMALMKMKHGDASHGCADGRAGSECSGAALILGSKYIGLP